MSSWRRRQMMQMMVGSTPPTPPIPYQRIEYLESSGTQYINTGIIPDSEYTIECEFIERGTQGANKHIVFGSGISYTSRNIELYSASNGSAMEVHYDSYFNIGNLILDTKYKFVQNKGVITIYNPDDSINGYKNFGIKTFTCPYNMVLFGINRGSIVITNQPVDIVSFKMIDGNNITVCDYYPVRVGTTGYLYDTISQQLYGNVGTGNFILGADI